ncbi:MAG: glycosyltransferase family 4 protein, partial [Muribaculaceae bacterium]|nr:glycosyltransferase family 4 protein [Muribaculaceae bacterium]
YNVEPILLAPFDSEDYSTSILKEARALGIKCISARFYPFKWYYNKKPVSFIKYASNFINYRSILKKIRKEKPDLIHTNSSIIDIGGFLSSKLKIKHVWHFREFGDMDFNMKPLLGRAQEKRLYRKADKFIAVSQSIKNRYLQYIQPESKINVIYNGLPLEEPSGLPKAENNDGIVRFCITGAINEAKRQIDALKSMDILINQRSQKNIHLYIVGDGWHREILEKFSKAHGLSEYVTFMGWINNVNEHIKRFDVGLTLSTNEGFGRVTVEYMRAGLAVIASDSGANPELIKDKETGLLYPVGNIEALSDKMALIANDSDLRHQIAKAGYEYSMTHFLSKDNTKAIYDLYTTLLHS